MIATVPQCSRVRSVAVNVENIRTADAVPAGPDAAWSRLRPLPLRPVGALRRRLADGQSRAATEPYDVLRTRTAFAMAPAGWTRLGVTQTRGGIAAPATALNLALAEARRPDHRVVLVELDLERSGLLRLTGHRMPRGATGPQRAMLKIRDNLALIAFSAPKDRAAETLLDPRFRAEVTRTVPPLAPDMVILHLPPVLLGDEGLAALDLADTILLAVDGTRDFPTHVRAAEQLIAPRRPLLGLFHYDAER